MIISRAPFRVSFCGGGSDIPDFFKSYGGCVISASIRKYVYIALHPAFNKNLITLKYSKTEIINDFDEIDHKIFKAVLSQYNIKGVEITSMADIPAGTGLGSSSSFTVALLKAIKAYTKTSYSPFSIANEACDIEINKLKNPIGKQDQFASAFGGLNYITFHKNGKVSVEPLLLPNGLETKLQNNLMLFYTGLNHDANKILKKQTENIIQYPEKIDAQKKLCALTKSLKKQLENGNIDYLGRILDKSWKIKKTLTSDISNDLIDTIYDKAIKAGAKGGKLLGAGGGGFLLFYVKQDKQESVRKALRNYLEMKFEIDHEGATIIYEKK